MSHQLKHARAGFSLVELLIVLLVLAGLMALVLPNVLGNKEKADVRTARVQILSIEEALDQFQMENNRYPSPQDGGLMALIVRPGTSQSMAPGVTPTTSQPGTVPMAGGIDPMTGMPMAGGTSGAIDPMTGMPMAGGTSGAIDPMTGMPMAGGTSGAIDPMTGMPMAGGTSGAIDPMTGMPMAGGTSGAIDPMTGMPMAQPGMMGGMGTAMPGTTMNASSSSSSYPDWDGPYLKDGKLPNDPWGNPYNYVYPGIYTQRDRPDVWSNGKDGISGNEDDVWPKDVNVNMNAQQQPMMGQNGMMQQNGTGAIDPMTGLPMQQNGMPGMNDPMNGMPGMNDPMNGMRGMNDPMNGMPGMNDPMNGMPGMNDPMNGMPGMNDPMNGMPGMNDPMNGMPGMNDPMNDPMNGMNDPMNGMPGMNDPMNGMPPMTP